MRQAPDATQKLRIVLPYFLVVTLEITSLWLVMPILGHAVANRSAAIFGQHVGRAEQYILYGVILSIPAFCQLIAAPALGYFSDHFGRRKVLLVCMIGSLLSLLLYAFGFARTSLLLLLGGRVLNGLTAASLPVAQTAMADISSGKARTKNIALIAVAMTVGIVLGPFLGGVLSDTNVFHLFTQTTPFIAAIILAIMCVLVVVVLLRETRTPSATQESYRFFSGLRVLLGHPRVLWLLGVFFLFELAWSLYFQSAALFVTARLHYGSAMTGIFLNYVALVMAAGLFVLVRLLLRFIRVPTMVAIGLFCNAIAYAAAWYGVTLAVQWAAATVLALGVALSYPGLKGLMSDAVAARQQGLLMGIGYALLCLAFGITALLSGWLSHLSFRLPYGMSALLCAAAWGLFMLYRLRSKTS